MDHLSAVADRYFRGLATLEPRLAIREARSLLEFFVRRPGFSSEIETSLAAARSVGRDPVWKTLAQGDEYTLQLFVWQAGAHTPIHDHTSWGVYACVRGELGEDRYVRVDDGRESGVAHLRRDWRSIWAAAELSALLPYAGGIHRVYNAGLAPAVSLHLYGPRLSALDGRDYDPQRDRVCDRPVEVELASSRALGAA